MAEKEFFPTLLGKGASLAWGHDLSKQDKPGIPATTPSSTWLGRYMYIGPFLQVTQEWDSNQFIYLDFTGPPGTATGIYYSLVFQMPKLQWHVEKVDEWIEVNPTHREYYERTIAAKGAIEGTIKEGLRSAAQAVADYELLKHDMRKYREIMDYFTAVAKAKTLPEKIRREKVAAAEHALKAMYVDQVDVHTGPSALVQMAQTRWPTIITDFMRVLEDMDTVEKIKKDLDVSGAEAVILMTKNKLFREWMKLFGDAVRERYERLSGLVASRDRSIEEYREWLRPYLLRFKAIKPSISTKQFRNFFDITGQATFTNNIRLWVWQPFKAIEIRKAPTIKTEKFAIEPADPFAVNHFIKSPVTGLAHKDYYPWLLNEQEPKGKASDYPWIPSDQWTGKVAVADNMIWQIRKDWIAGKIDKVSGDDMYYLMLDFKIERTGSRTPTGEMEDIIFDISMWVLSQNIMLVKLLELECRNREIGRYIEEMLGVQKDEKPIQELVKGEFPELFGVKQAKAPTQFELFRKEWGEIARSLSSPFRALSSTMGKPPPWLIRAGPYETNWDERITKQYLIPSGRKIGEVMGFLLGKMGFES
jgi:hypothetical protein